MLKYQWISTVKYFIYHVRVLTELYLVTTNEIHIPLNSIHDKLIISRSILVENAKLTNLSHISTCGSSQTE
jgi:hypothetical protein